MRVRRERTSWDTSLMIFAFSLGDKVVNHFARRWTGISWLTGGEYAWQKTYDFALPRQQNQVAALCQQVGMSGRPRATYLMGIFSREEQ